METLFITWNADGMNHLPYLSTIVDKLRGGDPSIGVIIGLQEVSMPGCDKPYKIGRKNFLYCGTDKDQSGNQRCNTVILWENEKFTRLDRYTQFHSNRYWECIKLRAKDNNRDFWVMSVHGPAGGPANYAANGRDISEYLHKFALERAPLIALGDMNCQPANMVTSGSSAVISCGHPTRPKSGAELDFLVTSQRIAIGCAGVVDAEVSESDHRGVGFRATI